MENEELKILEINKDDLNFADYYLVAMTQTLEDNIVIHRRNLLKYRRPRPFIPDDLKSMIEKEIGKVEDLWARQEYEQIKELYLKYSVQYLTDTLEIYPTLLELKYYLNGQVEKIIDGIIV